MKQLWILSRKIIFKNIRSILLFEIIYRTGTILALLPLLTKILSIELRLVGYSYLTPKNILNYMSHPLTILILIAALLIGLLLTLMEICSLFVCFRYSYHGIHISVSEMILIGLRKTKQILKKNKLCTWLWLLLLFPLVNLHLIVLLGFNIPVVSYLIEALYTGVSNKKVIYWIISITFFAGILCMFIVPCFLLERKSFKDSIKTAFSLIRRHVIKSSFYLILCNLFITVVIAVQWVLFIFMAVIYVRFFSNPETALAQVLKLDDSIVFLVSYLAGILGMVCNTGLIFSLYTKLRANQAKIDVVRYGFRNSKELIVKKTKRITFLCLFTIFLLEGITAFQLIRNGSTLIQDVLTPIAITAHRGGALYAPENTIEALQSAIDNLADYAEIDVQETADGVVVLLHDLNLKRTTGVNEYVYNMTYEQIRQLNAGNYFGAGYEDTYIPTLAEILEMCKGKINLNIEIKNNARYSELPKKVVELVKKYDFEEQCTITSMNYDYLAMVKEADPNIRTGYIMKVAIGNFSKLKYADFFSMKYSYVTDHLVEDAHEAGKEVHVWTVNTRNAINKMKGMEVDNIITDNPVLVRKILAKKNGDNTFLDLLNMFLPR